MQNSGPQTFQEAEALIRQQFGDAVQSLGMLEFWVETGQDQVPCQYTGCFPWALAQQACAPLLLQYLEDINSAESIAALKHGKRLKYYLYSPKELVNSIVDKNIEQETIEGVPVMHLPLGVYEQTIQLVPPVTLSTQ